MNTCICSLNAYVHANIHTISIQIDKTRLRVKNTQKNIEENPRCQEIVTGRNHRIADSGLSLFLFSDIHPEWCRSVLSTLVLRFLTFFSMCSSFFKGLSCMHNANFHLRKVYLTSVLLPSSRTMQSSDRCLVIIPQLLGDVTVP